MHPVLSHLISSPKLDMGRVAVALVGGCSEEGVCLERRGPSPPPRPGVLPTPRASSTSPWAPMSTSPGPWHFNPEHNAGHRVSLPQYVWPTPPADPAPASPPGTTPGDPAFSARTTAGYTHHTLNLRRASLVTLLVCMLTSMCLLTRLTTCLRRAVLLPLCVLLPLVLVSSELSSLLSLASRMEGLELRR